MRSLTVSSLLLFCIPAVVLSQPRICYFGDSITDGWMNAERHPDLAYPAMLDSMLAAQGIAFESIVTAHGGETTDDAIARTDRDVMDENADVVVFAFGSNDYFIWGVPPASRVPIERFRYNCRILLRKLTGTGARVIVLTPPPVLSSRFYQYFDSSLYSGAGGVAALRTLYADILQQLATEIPGVRAVLSDSIFVDDSLVGFDGVHPLPEGHRRIAEALFPVILKAIAEG
ncbi:MAG: SGNH/GDSL hydrolase family protein, partial [Bacteroidota bacterium]